MGSYRAGDISGRTDHTSELSSVTPGVTYVVLPFASHTIYPRLAMQCLQLQFVRPHHRCLSIIKKKNQATSLDCKASSRQRLMRRSSTQPWDALPCVTQLRHPAPQPPHRPPRNDYLLLGISFGLRYLEMFCCKGYLIALQEI